MKVSVILTAAALAFGTSAFAESAHSQKNMSNSAEATRNADQPTAGEKIRDAAKRAGDKTRNAMNRMRDRDHDRDTARSDRDRDMDHTRAMGASRGDDRERRYSRDDRGRRYDRDDRGRRYDRNDNDRARGYDRGNDEDQGRRERMDDAYANWRSSQQR